MIWAIVALVAAIGIWGPDCHQSATLFPGEGITPELAAKCNF